MHDCFHLRMLLNHVIGPTSFEYLRTVNGVIYSTYQEACGALNLLDDDTHWIETLSEAKHYRSANKIRETFAIIIVFGQPASAINLWEQFEMDMYEDFLYKYKDRFPNFSEAHCIQYATNQDLSDLQAKLKTIGGHNLIDYGLPVPQTAMAIEEPELNVEELKSYIAQNEPLLNDVYIIWLYREFKIIEGKQFFWMHLVAQAKRFFLKCYWLKSDQWERLLLQQLLRVLLQPCYQVGKRHIVHLEFHLI